MTEAQLPDFNDLMRRVCATFRVRTDDENFSLLVQSYFKVLQPLQFTDVEKGAEVWMAGQPRFPKPVEWKQAVPHKHVEYPALSMPDAREWRRAELQGWEDDPCTCAHCCEAGVNDKPLRFVPELDELDRDVKAKHPWLQEPVTRGHWAHGRELARWYEARADFYNRYMELIGGITSKRKRQKIAFRERMDRIYNASRNKHSDFTAAQDVDPLKLG